MAEGSNRYQYRYRYITEDSNGYRQRYIAEGSNRYRFIGNYIGIGSPPTTMWLLTSNMVPTVKLVPTSMWDMIDTFLDNTMPVIRIKLHSNFPREIFPAELPGPALLTIGLHFEVIWIHLEHFLGQVCNSSQDSCPSLQVLTHLTHWQSHVIMKTCQQPIFKKHFCPKPNDSTIQPQNCSWVRHENNCAHPTPPTTQTQRKPSGASN